MNSIQEAARLNDEGISQLVVGNCEHAIASFQSSMQILKGSRSDEGQEPSSAPDVLNSVARRSTTTSAIPEDNMFHMFRYGVHFMPTTTTGRLLEGGSILDTKANRQLCGAIVSFNMAIAYHMQGIAFANHNDRANGYQAFRRAFQFYQVTMELADLLAMRSDSAQQLIIVGLNNQAQIYHKLGNNSDALTKLELLQSISTFSYDVEDHRNSDNVKIIDENDINKFCINANRISEPIAAPSA